MLLLFFFIVLIVGREVAPALAFPVALCHSDFDEGITFVRREIFLPPLNLSEMLHDTPYIQI